VVGLMLSSSLDNTTSYNPPFVSATMICWPGRLDRGEALDGTMPKNEKGSHRKATRRDPIGCHASDTNDQVCDKEGIL
jgi:hypothetical protein